MDKKLWTIKSCLEWTINYLTKRGDEHPRLSAEWLLGSATGKKRIELYMSFPEPMTERELAAMHTAVVRRASGEPLQYIVGETSFRMLDVYCEPGVLIPRPETELLVEDVINYLRKSVLGAGTVRRARTELPWNSEVERVRQEERDKRVEAASGNDEIAGTIPSDGPDRPLGAQADRQGECRVDDGGAVPDEGAEGRCDSCPQDMAPAGARPFARVLEVGCGTGCISLSIASELEGKVRCVATDIEPRAVRLAERNRMRADISEDAACFREGDLVAPVLPAEQGTFDVLVSNPPYIPTAVLSTMPHEVVGFEPRLALDGGADGLGIFRRLLSVAPNMLRPGGLFACELHEDCLDRAAGLCRAAGMHDVRVVPDLTGRPRFVFARTDSMGR